MLFAEDGTKKQLIFEKRDHFENGQNGPQCKGYGLWKMLTLGQNLKFQKTFNKRLYMQAH